MPNGKILDNTNGGESLELAPDFFQTPKLLHGTFSFFRVMPEFSNHYKEWQELCELNAQDTLDEQSLADIKIGRPNSHQGDIACGLVSQSKSYKAKLKQINRKILAIETEFGAIARFCQDNEIDFIVIRGISDEADDTKSHFELETKDCVRKIAAFNAFQLLHYQLWLNPSIGLKT